MVAFLGFDDIVESVQSSGWLTNFGEFVGFVDRLFGSLITTRHFDECPWSKSKGNQWVVFDDLKVECGL